MNKFFKNKFAKTSTKTAEPRQISEINKDYSNLCAQAGQLETAIRLNKKQLESVYSALENINSEANARSRLDQEALNTKSAPQDTPVVTGATEVSNG